MAISGVCPSCGYKFALQLALQDARSRKALLACLKIAPSLADRLIVYLELFSPGDRAIRADRLANLLEELSEKIHKAQVERNGVVWVAPLDSWKAGLDSVLARRSDLTLPLPNHAYLYQTVANIANKSAAKVEQQTEQQRQTGIGNRSCTMEKAVPNVGSKPEDFAETAKAIIKGGPLKTPKQED